MKRFFICLICLMLIIVLPISTSFASTVTFNFPFVVLDSSGSVVTSNPGSQVYRVTYDDDGTILANASSLSPFSLTDENMTFHLTNGMGTFGSSSLLCRVFFRTRLPDFDKGTIDIGLNCNITGSSSGQPVVDYYHDVDISLYAGTLDSSSIVNNSVNPIIKVDYQSRVDNSSNGSSNFIFSYSIDDTYRDMLYRFQDNDYYWFAMDFYVTSSTNIYIQVVSSMTVSYDSDEQKLPLAEDRKPEVDAANEKMENAKNEALGGKTEEQIDSEVESALDFDFSSISSDDSSSVSGFLDDLLGVFGDSYSGALFLSLTLGLACFIIGRRYA